MKTPTTFAAESGHWYQADGTPAYEIVGANGKTRPTTIRDARKLNLYPSVTTIIRLMDAPGLTRWKMTQFGLACLTLPKLPDESLDAFMERAAKDSQEEGKKAAALGEYIHGGIERHYRDEPVDPELLPWVQVATAAIESLCGPQTWSAERSFASPLGYGGKVDLHSDQWVLDIKTKADDKTDLFDEHFMQLAAYQAGLMLGPMARCGIVFVNRLEPRAVAVQASLDDLRKGGDMFDALLALHQAKNRYKPT